MPQFSFWHPIQSLTQPQSGVDHISRNYLQMHKTMRVAFILENSLNDWWRMMRCFSLRQNRCKLEKIGKEQQLPIYWKATWDKKDTIHKVMVKSNSYCCLDSQQLKWLWLWVLDSITLPQGVRWEGRGVVPGFISSCFCNHRESAVNPNWIFSPEWPFRSPQQMWLFRNQKERDFCGKCCKP